MSETIISQKKSFLDLNESELNEILTSKGIKNISEIVGKKNHLD